MYLQKLEDISCPKGSEPHLTPVKNIYIYTYVCMYSVCVFFKHIQYTLEIQGLKKHVLMNTRRKWIKKVRP
jgi:hypothetical protein